MRHGNLCVHGLAGNNVPMRAASPPFSPPKAHHFPRIAPRVLHNGASTRSTLQMSALSSPLKSLKARLASSSNVLSIALSKLGKWSIYHCFVYATIPLKRSNWNVRISSNLYEASTETKKPV